ncbi:MAG: FixH family protein [Bdellovibrionaceae bacterium]|nr:FixH family protein [Pseudobdellovibrionaceae bacterium]
MFGKTLVLLSLLIVLPACAEPRYAPADSGDKVGRVDATVDGLRAELPVSGTDLVLVWETEPTDEREGSFLLKFGHRDPVSGELVVEEIEGEISVVLWMPSMGHGSSPVKVERLSVGAYRASDVFFVMPGDWEIRIQRRSGGRVLEQATLALRI